MFVFIRGISGAGDVLGNIAENILPLKKFWGERGQDSEFSAFEFDEAIRGNLPQRGESCVKY
jgi:hypothetical protein